MITTLIAVFLVLHGLVHLAIWLPQPKPDGQPPPFEPDHSAVLTSAMVSGHTAHTLSVALAVGSTSAYVAAGFALGLSGDYVLPLAVAAAVSGLVLKLVFFHPWLSIGIALDVAVLLAATTAWPLDLS